MDRLTVYPGAIPLDTDILSAQKNAYYGLGWLAQAAIGTSVAVVGLTVAPTAPASLQVVVAPGAIFALETVDTGSFGSLGTDANQIVKQGIAPASQNLTLTPPTTTGFSTNYLVQVAFAETDDTPVTLPYYNAADPSVAWIGPNNSGTSQNTRRHDQCVVSLKAGTPAATGSQTTPSPDAGYTGLYVVTVANGQTAITSGNISQMVTAPFFSTLPGVPANIQNGSWVYGEDTGALNALAVSVYPAPDAYVEGMHLLVKVANTVTGATTINVNGLGVKSIIRPSGGHLLQGDLVGGGISHLIYDGTNFQAIDATSQAVLRENSTIYVNESIGNDNNDGTANDAGHALASLQGAINLAFSYGPSAFTLTIQMADGTYAAGATPVQPGPPLAIVGNNGSPANVAINGGTANAAVSCNGPNTMTASGVKVSTGTPGKGAAGFLATNGASLTTNNTHSGSVEGAVFESFNANCTAGSHSFDGNSAYAMQAQVGGDMSLAAGAVYTISSAITLTAFAFAVNGGILAISATTPTFVNPSNVTGARYLANLNGVINANGQGATYFPGSTAGSTSAGGQYA